jgi:hypothetical protein
MLVRDPQPTPQEQQALGQIILKHLIKANSKQRRPVVEFLFRELASEGDKSFPLTPAAVLLGMKDTVNPDSLSRMRTLKTRLVADCDRFFNYLEGAKEKWCVYFESGDYRPHFRANTPPSKAVDYLAQFWGPHRESIYPTHILYPEPCFFQDDHNTYLRNPDANRLQDHSRFAYLSERERPDEPYDKTLKTAHSYVPSGTVSALLHLMAYFRSWGQELAPVPFRPDDTVPDKANLIVLGTSTSMQAVATLERSLPFYTGLKHIEIVGEQPLKDTEYIEHDERMFHKWGTVTRRWFKYPDRIVTVISAHHGRAVEAIASFLTNHSSLSTLAELLNNPKALPLYFQALFSVHMEEKPRGPLPTSTEVKRAVEIKQHLAAMTRGS